MRSDLVFGLVHGAWHRGACWEPLAAELDGRGFASVAMDLPADQADAGVTDYAAQVTAALREVDGPVVLVGHSLGGLTIPVVAAHRPVALLVYLCAALPDPGPRARRLRRHSTHRQNGWPAGSQKTRKVVPGW